MMDLLKVLSASVIWTFEPRKVWFFNLLYTSTVVRDGFSSLALHILLLLPPCCPSSQLSPYFQALTNVMFFCMHVSILRQVFPVPLNPKSSGFKTPQRQQSHESINQFSKYTVSSHNNRQTSFHQAFNVLRSLPSCQLQPFALSFSYKSASDSCQSRVLRSESWHLYIIQLTIHTPNSSRNQGSQFFAHELLFLHSSRIIRWYPLSPILPISFR